MERIRGPGARGRRRTKRRRSRRETGDAGNPVGASARNGWCGRVVATTAAVEEFGLDGQRRGDAAEDVRGQETRGGWTTAATGSSRWGRMHFDGWLQILDFLHLLVHLYAAARLAYSGNPKTAWELYERMLAATPGTARCRR